MKKKNNASQFAAGANLSFMKSHFVGGVSAYYTSLDKRLSPNTNSLYRRYYPHGEHFYGMSVDYGYRSGLFSFRGETATGSSHAWATINTMSYRLASNFTMRLVQRYYSYKYYSLFSQSYSDGGRVQNESGVYVGADWKPFGGLLLSYYADAAYFPWARYQASTASRSFDNLFSAVYTTGRLHADRALPAEETAERQCRQDGTDLQDRPACSPGGTIRWRQLEHKGSDRRHHNGIQRAQQRIYGFSRRWHHGNTPLRHLRHMRIFPHRRLLQQHIQL